MSDGRNIDSDLGTLSGEGSHQRGAAALVPSQVLQTTGYGVLGNRTYYDHPVIKKSVWSWDIPAYYYVGGATGSAMALGAAATLINRDQLSRLVLHSRMIGVAGSTISAYFLIHDLGRPERFLNMMRVFRPTSPMSVGAWILTFFSTSAGLAAVSEFGPRWARPFGDVAAIVSGLFGLGLAGYTGVLVAHTTVPVWQRPHRIMPALFLSSGVTGAASLFDLLGGNALERRAVSVFGAAGRLAELGFAHAMEQSVATVPEAARPLQEGLSGFLWKSAKILTAASLVLSLVPRASPRVRRVAGVLGTMGSLCVRFGVHYAGQSSAMNPRATFQQQRSGQGAFEVTGRAAVTGPGGTRAFIE
jgi:formate-dependent nitrite reductase membrane component NrfD